MGNSIFTAKKIIAFVAAGLFLVTGCSQISTDTATTKNETIDETKANLTLQCSSGTTRSLDVPVYSNYSYTVESVDTEGTAHTVLYDVSFAEMSSANAVVLEPGTWQILVKGYRCSTLMVEGSISAAQYNAGTDTVYIELATVCSDSAISSSIVDATRSDTSSTKIKTVVISDIHMGDSRAINGLGTFTDAFGTTRTYTSYGWFVRNRQYLIKFLSWLNESDQRKVVKTLVIAGDLFDEWVAPFELTAYTTADEAETDFIGDIATADDYNKAVIAGLKALTQGENAIDVHYVPGNHDMLATSADLDRADVFGDGTSGSSTVTYESYYDVDGTKQQAGLGLYVDKSLGDGKWIAIEHGHRYDIYNAPDMLSQSGSILPVGFFVAKWDSTYRQEMGMHSTDSIAADYTVTSTGSRGIYNEGLWEAAWRLIRKYETVYNVANRKIKANIDGYTASYYSIFDFATLPYFYDDIQGYDARTIFTDVEDQWDARQTKNGVVDNTGITHALYRAKVNSSMDAAAEEQYFNSSTNPVRVVIFGHTHETRAALYNSDHGIFTGYRWNIQANSGAWVDRIDLYETKEKKSCNYIVITPSAASDPSSITVSVNDWNTDSTTTNVYQESITF